MIFSLNSLPDDEHVRVYAAIAVAATLLDGYYKTHKIQPGDSLSKIPSNSKLNLRGNTESIHYIWTALMWLAGDPKFAKCLNVAENAGFNPRDEFKFFGGYKSTSLYKRIFTPIIGEHKVEYTPDERNKPLGHHAPTKELQRAVACNLTDPLIRTFFEYNKERKKLSFNEDKSLEELQRIGALKLGCALAFVPPEDVKKLDLTYLHAAKIFDFEGCKLLLRSCWDIKELVLGINDLVALGANRLKELLEVIPESVTSLDLGLCNLGQLTPDELIHVLSGVPATVRSLDLSFNNLNQLVVSMIRIAKSIPAEIEVNFKHNDFSEGMLQFLVVERERALRLLKQQQAKGEGAKEALLQRSMPVASAPEASASSSGQTFFRKEGQPEAKPVAQAKTYGMGKS